MTTTPSTTWRLLIAYNGGGFKGWQRGNGRTDAGARAEGQVASVVLSIAVHPAQLLAAANRALPGVVSVLSVEQAEDRYRRRPGPRPRNSGQLSSPAPARDRSD